VLNRSDLDPASFSSLVASHVVPLPALTIHRLHNLSAHFLFYFARTSSTISTVSFSRAFSKNQNFKLKYTNIFEFAHIIFLRTLESHQMFNVEARLKMFAHLSHIAHSFDF
jgi:hypothetical protein